MRRLHPLLSARQSPTAYDSAHEVSPSEVASLLEAARWAPSAGNSQPWSFIVGQRGHLTHRRIVRHLAKSSAHWAPAASLLVVNLAHRYVQETDWEYSEFSLYDLGQAVAHMTVQAQAMDLAVRQFRAFDREALAADFSVPPHWQVTTISAFGRAVADETMPGHRLATAPRARRSLVDIVWPNDTTSAVGL